MSLKSLQSAALYLAVLRQRSIDQLNAIQKKYSEMANKSSFNKGDLTEPFEKIQLPYSNTLSAQKRFIWLCERYAIEKYLEKDLLAFLAFLRALEIAEFDAEQERIDEERHQLEMEYIKEYALSQVEALMRIQAMEKNFNKMSLQEIERIDREIKKLQDEAKKLQMIFYMLRDERKFLAKRVQRDLQEFDNIIVKLYKNCSLNNEIDEINIGDYSFFMPYAELGNRLAAYVEGRVANGLIQISKIPNDEREMILSMINEDVPEINRKKAGDKKINDIVEDVFQKFQQSKKIQAGYNSCEKLKNKILADQRKIEIIDVQIEIAKKTAGVMGQAALSLQNDGHHAIEQNEVTSELLNKVNALILSAEGVVESFKLENDEHIKFSQSQQDIGDIQIASGLGKIAQHNRVQQLNGQAIEVSNKKMENLQKDIGIGVIVDLELDDDKNYIDQKLYGNNSSDPIQSFRQSGTPPAQQKAPSDKQHMEVSENKKENLQKDTGTIAELELELDDTENSRDQKNFVNNSPGFVQQAEAIPAQQLLPSDKQYMEVSEYKRENLQKDTGTIAELELELDDAENSRDQKIFANNSAAFVQQSEVPPAQQLPPSDKIHMQARDNQKKNLQNDVGHIADLKVYLNDVEKNMDQKHFTNNSQAFPHFFKQSDAHPAQQSSLEKEKKHSGKRSAIYSVENLKRKTDAVHLVESTDGEKSNLDIKNSEPHQNNSNRGRKP